MIAKEFPDHSHITRELVPVLHVVQRSKQLRRHTTDFGCDFLECELGFGCRLRFGFLADLGLEFATGFGLPFVLIPVGGACAFSGCASGDGLFGWFLRGLGGSHSWIQRGLKTVLPMEQ